MLLIMNLLAIDEDIQLTRSRNLVFDGGFLFLDGNFFFPDLDDPVSVLNGSAIDFILKPILVHADSMFARCVHTTATEQEKC